MFIGDSQLKFGCDLWDALAEFPASRVDEALNDLMRRTAAQFDAQNVVWVGAARLRQGVLARRDALHGWRGLAVRHYNTSPEIQDRTQFASKTQESNPDLTTRALAAGTGRLRVHRLHDGFVDIEAMKKTESYRVIYKETGIVDRMFVGIPVNADAESFLLVDRYQGPHFTAAEAEVLEFAMKGLKWFHRELLLGNGLLMAQEPLTATERRVVHLLLTERSEREIADALRQSPKTTHKHVTSILHKYGVKSRPALMALWLNRR
jgi:DNA-binding CsgD family transcriptional regulator